MFRRCPLQLGLSFLLLSIAMLCACLRLAAQEPAAQDGPLQANGDVPRAHFVTNDTILRMAKAGLNDDVLLQTIQLQPGRYDTSPDDLIALRKGGVSDRVIAAMQAHAAGLNIHPSAGSEASPTPLAPGIDEIGVYYKLPPGSKNGGPTGEWMPLKTERVVFRSSGAAKNILTHGIISKDMDGDVDGAKSDLVLPTGVQILIYAPNGTDASEYEFLRLEEHSKDREFRVMTGGVFHSHTGSDRDEIDFHPHRVAPQMYVFTVPVDIEKGEYGVLPPGSSNAQGIAGTGKIFTFSIRE
jgi:hypothetical protein